MKKLLTLAGAWLCCAVPSHAVLWTGTIHGLLDLDCEPFESSPGEWETYVICEVFPSFYEWTAVYQYESNSIDGEFHYFSGNARVDGFFGGAGGAWNGPIIPWGEAPLDYPQITVEDGKVKTFFYIDDPFIKVELYADGWGGWDFDGLGGGEIVISDPVRLAVPDSDSTLPMAALALWGLTALRHARSREESVWK